MEQPIPTPWERHPEEYWANGWGPPPNYIRCASCRAEMFRYNARRGWRIVFNDEDGWLGVICPRKECWLRSKEYWDRQADWPELKVRPIRLENIIFAADRGWAGAKKYWPERL